MSLWKRLFGLPPEVPRQVTADGIAYSVTSEARELAAIASTTGRAGLHVAYATADDSVLGCIDEFRASCGPEDAYRLEKALIGGRLICEGCRTAYKYAAMSFITNYDGRKCPRCGGQSAIIVLQSDPRASPSFDLVEAVWSLRAGMLAVLMWESEKAGVGKRPLCNCGTEVRSAESGYFVSGWGPICEGCRQSWAPKSSEDRGSITEDEMRMAGAHAEGTLDGFGPHVHSEIAKWVKQLSR